MNDHDRLIDLLEAERETADAERARAEKAEAERDALQAKLDAAVAQGHKSALRVLALEAVVEKARAYQTAERERCAISVMSVISVEEYDRTCFAAHDAEAALFAALDALEVERG